MPDRFPPPSSHGERPDVPDTPDELGENQVELEFTPIEGSVGGVEPLAFSEYLEALIRALRLTAKHVDRRTDARFEILKLSYNSPLQMLLEGRAQNGGRAALRESISFFTDAVNALQRGEHLPARVDLSLLRALNRVGEASKRSRLAVAVRTRRSMATVQPQLYDRVQLIIEDDIEVDGTFEGYLHLLNVHGRPLIRIYPHAGPFITGRVPRKLIPKAKASVEEYVLVEGTLIFRPNEVHPRRIRVKEIHAIERREPIPTFEDLWGLGRGYRPQTSSVDLIGEMRSGWE